MSDPTRPNGSTAVFAVVDIAASLAYYESALGFETAFTWGEPTYYAGVCRGDVTIHLQAASHAERPVGASVLYVFVDDANAVHAELRERGARILKPPATYDYGLVDFDVADPDGNRVVYASEAPTGAA